MRGGRTDALRAFAVERRFGRRLQPSDTVWPAPALLRPGRDVLILNLSAGGALVESRSRVMPGARTALQLLGDARRDVGGRIARCRVCRLAPLCYEAAIAFDDPLHVILRLEVLG